MDLDKTPHPWSRSSRSGASWSRLARDKRNAKVRQGGALTASLAIHMAMLLYFGSQLTDPYRLPEPSPEDLPPVEAYLLPPQELEPPPRPAPPAPVASLAAPMPALRPVPVAPITPVNDEDKDKPISRATPLMAHPRQVAPSAPLPVDVAPLDMVPVASPPVSARAAGGTNASPPLAGANGDFIVKPMPLVPGSLRSALRGSTVGCDNRNAVALNKAERSVCDDRIGVRGANAPYIPVGTELGRDDRRDFDTQADLARRLREWKAAQAPPGTGASETGINGLGPAKPKATP